LDDAQKYKHFAKFIFPHIQFSKQSSKNLGCIFKNISLPIDNEQGYGNWNVFALYMKLFNIE